jgi:hypothetical protein
MGYYMATFARIGPVNNNIICIRREKMGIIRPSTVAANGLLLI